jgi:hypothetical protein
MRAEATSALGFVVGEHHGRQIEARAQAVAHAGLALDGHALVQQVGHVAVNGALGHLQPLGQKTPPWSAVGPGSAG